MFRPLYVRCFVMRVRKAESSFFSDRIETFVRSAGNGESKRAMDGLRYKM